MKTATLLDAPPWQLARGARLGLYAAAPHILTSSRATVSSPPMAMRSSSQPFTRHMAPG